MNYFYSCTLIKIGLCSSQNGIQTSMVLAGDPKQLDAICKSTNAAKLGFNVSLMERLFRLPLYKQDVETNQYNPQYITQLVKNYRSHIAILHVANALFYNGKLKCKASKGM